MLRRLVLPGAALAALLTLLAVLSAPANAAVAPAADVTVTTCAEATALVTADTGLLTTATTNLSLGLSTGVTAEVLATLETAVNTAKATLLTAQQQALVLCPTETTPPTTETTAPTTETTAPTTSSSAPTSDETTAPTTSTSFVPLPPVLHNTLPVGGAATGRA